MSTAETYERARADEHKNFTKKLVRWLGLERTQRRSYEQNRQIVLRGEWIAELDDDASREEARVSK